MSFEGDMEFESTIKQTGIRLTILETVLSVGVFHEHLILSCS